MGAENSKSASPPMDFVEYNQDRYYNDGGGGVDPPASWNTSSNNFQQISPTSDISAPSRFIHRQQQRHRHQHRSNLRLSEQIPPIQESYSKEESAGGRKSARYRNENNHRQHHRTRPQKASASKESSSAPHQLEQQKQQKQKQPRQFEKLKAKKERIKKSFMGCVEESAHKVEKVKDEALVPVARKVKSGLNTTGKATKHITRVAVTSLREKRHVTNNDKVKEVPPNTRSDTPYLNKNNLLDESAVNPYYDEDDGALPYSTANYLDQQEFQNSDSYYITMDEIKKSVEASSKGPRSESSSAGYDSRGSDESDLSSNLDKNVAIKSSSHQSHATGVSTKVSSQPSSIPTPMVQLDERFSAEMTLHHEDSYFNRLAAAKASPAFQKQHQDSPIYASPLEGRDDLEMATPVASLFQKPELSISKQLLRVPSIAPDDHGGKKSTKERNVSKEPSNEETKITAPQMSKTHKDSKSQEKRKKGSKKATEKAKSVGKKTGTKEPLAQNKQNKNMNVSTDSAYELDTKWLKLTPDPAPEQVAAKKVFREAALSKAQIKSSRSLESSMIVSVTETAPSMMETYETADPHMVIKKSKSAPGALEDQKSAKPTSSHQGQEDTRVAKSQKIDDYDAVSYPIPAMKNTPHTNRHNEVEATPKLSKQHGEEQIKHQTQASEKTDLRALFSPSEDSLLDGSVASVDRPPVSLQALSNAAFLFSPSYAGGDISLLRQTNTKHETCLSISTTESRNRLCNFSSRARPHVSIPASSSQVSDNVSRLTKTYSYEESVIEGSVLHRKASSQANLSKKSVRFSDSSDTEEKTTSQVLKAPTDFTVPAVESKFSDLTDNTGDDNTKTSKIEHSVEKEDEPSGPEPSSSVEESFSGWSYRETEDGKLSSVTPDISRSASKTKASKKTANSPMQRFFAAKNKFANPSKKKTPAKKTPPKRFSRRNPKNGLVSSRVTELNGRLRSSRQPALKNARRETGGHNVLAPKPATLVNPLFAYQNKGSLVKESPVLDRYSSPQESTVHDGDSKSGPRLPSSEDERTVSTSHSINDPMFDSTESSDIFSNLRTSTSNGEPTEQKHEDASATSDEAEDVFAQIMTKPSIDQHDEAEETFSQTFTNPSIDVGDEDDEAEDVFSQIMSKPSIDISEAPSVATLRSRFSTDRSEATSVATMIRGEINSSSMANPNDQTVEAMSFATLVRGETSFVSIDDSKNQTVESAPLRDLLEPLDTESVTTSPPSISYLPSFGSYAPVNPREQWQHDHTTPGNLCLSPLQRTPMQARKWRTLAAAAKERDQANKKGKKSSSKKNRKAFQERSMNVF